MADSTKLENKGLYKPMLYQFVLPIMQLKHVFDPTLVYSNERHSRNPIKVHQLLSSPLSHIKPLFQQIFHNLKPFVQIKINFHLSVLNFC